MIDPLPPDIRFEQLVPNPEDIAFAFSVKKEALGPHIRVRWPWDDDYQMQIHRQRFAEKPFFRIWWQQQPVGTLSWLVDGERARFGEFYIFTEFQGVGLGTRILKHVLSIADADGLPIRLEYLKWNPVGSLYLRNGFVGTHESDIHVFLERLPIKKIES